VRKSDCKTGMAVWGKYRGASYLATVRVMAREDVHLEWSERAVKVAAEHGFQLPGMVGYDDLTQADAQQIQDGQATVALDPKPAPDARADTPPDGWTEWGEFWHRFEHILEDRRRLSREIRDALPQAEDTLIIADSILSMPQRLVTDLGLTGLRERQLKIRKRLGDLKLDAACCLQSMYDKLVRDPRLDGPPDPAAT